MAHPFPTSRVKDATAAMNAILRPSLFGTPSASPWRNTAPVREEMFGVERLEQHAQSLAAAQPVSLHPPRVLSLHKRLNANASVLLAAYRASAAAVERGLEVVPAAEWLLDNYHLVDEQIREIREDLPPGFYRQLPKLAEGPFAGYPRVFGLAWAFVAHTDSYFDPATLRRFIDAYQRVQPLTIGELWAVAITLRIVLIENLRRLADQMTAGRHDREDAQRLADRLFAAGNARSALDADIASRPPGPLSEVFAAQLARRLRDKDPDSHPALNWLRERLALQGSSIDGAVRHAQERLGASNLSVRNVITSMRLISSIDWALLIESVSLVDARLRNASGFAEMDFASRNLYRSAVEQLARGSPCSELQVVEHALAACQHGAEARQADPGYHLIAEGRLALEATLGFRPSARLRLTRLHIRLGLGGYVGAQLTIALLLLALLAWQLADPQVPMALLGLFLIAGFFPFMELANTLVNRAVAMSFGARSLPGLALLDGVPTQLRTLVAVPSLLTSEAELLAQVEQLQVHCLASGSGDLTYALLLDGLDAAEQTLAQDAQLLAVGREAIARLNQQHPPGPAGPRFLLLDRQRRWCASEQCWMGWERKRGKLHELNQLLRGATDTSYSAGCKVPAGVRYVITLDADTRLPLDTAQRLIGKLAHPLNRPVLAEDGQRLLFGHGILQPRVTPSLPLGQEGSLYQRVFSSPGGMDPYAAAVSDVYQDLFGEGSYTGKGIYDVDAFEAALAGRVSDSTMLSHDLYEGIHARAALVTDIEVVEQFPPRYDVIAKRQHRWTRGDWQLLPWLAPAGLPAVGRWKMIDNLRRSLTAPFTLLALMAGGLLPWPQALYATLATLLCSAAAAFLPSVFALLPSRRGIRWASHWLSLRDDLRLAVQQWLLSLTFLPDQAWRMLDAIIRTLYRLGISRRLLLEWTTAAQAGAGPRLTLAGCYRQMAAGTALGLIGCALVVAVMPSHWPLVLPLALLWAAAPALALYTSRPPAVAPALEVDDEQAQDLRLIARATWRYFETFVTPLENHLPPDNFQEDPKPVIAQRTSPTNMGLYLLSAVAARDFGWAASLETLDRLESTFAVMQRLPRFKGHFYNWYDTRSLLALAPAYVSSVDSGNLAGHLIALANACEQWRSEALPDPRRGLLDTLHLALSEINSTPARELLDQLAIRLHGAQSFEVMQPGLKRLLDKACSLQSPSFWLTTLRNAVSQHARDREPGDGLQARLAAVAEQARGMAMAMDFAFLLDPERKLLSIGYSPADHHLDSNCYDLLASEARLASLFAIAKGDVSARHWFRLGRSATPVGRGSALISWSGSMFEYLMPSLVMRAPLGSLLEQTNRLVVARQQEYAGSLGIPWGISESAYNARDIEFTYQYSNFGVPGLGLKRGLAQSRVIAPYACALAAMVDAPGAWRNFGAMGALGARGRYGFYEALDFTSAHLPDKTPMAIVRNYMAHHQGMSIVAIANVLQHGRMRERFHREPMIQACELLLQERMPRDVNVAHPRAEEVPASASKQPDGNALRHLYKVAIDAPVTHLLSNSRYSVMLTAAGGGYSRWHDIAVSRWREDPTLDPWGSALFVRDHDSTEPWLAGQCMDYEHGQYGDVTFAEDHAQFISQHPGLHSTLNVLVSGEDDAEVRHLTLSNTSQAAKTVELTSYTELVLTSAAADTAHPAFAKLFVITEYLAEFGALLATRRPRSPSEAPIWAAHFAVLEADLASHPQFETDRARFIGRGRSLAHAQAMDAEARLSNTVGTVLDPIFALRHRLRIGAGETVEVAFWTVVASTRTQLLDLIDKHHERNAFERAKTLAWTQAQVQLRHLGIDSLQAADFQRMSAPLLYADRKWRSDSASIVRGMASQAGLWPMGISGDLPIVLLRIDDQQDLAQVQQLLQAHEYWRMKRLSVDLVIINERRSSYLQDLQVAIETAVRSSQSRPGPRTKLSKGAVHVLRADLLSPASLALLQSVARIVLRARGGLLHKQLLARLEPPQPTLPTRWPSAGRHATAFTGEVGELEFFNGLGGFALGGREYVTVLDGKRTTPAPWLNVVANPAFGFQVSADGSGYTWAGNSKENQLTPWSNDPVCDPPGEALYVRDEASGELYSPTASPIRDHGQYIARHGFGYSRFSHQVDELALDLLQYVPLADPLKISRLTLRNLSSRRRQLSVTAYAQWVLGSSPAASATFITTSVCPVTGALLATNRWSNTNPGAVAFADLSPRAADYTCDRSEFLGRQGSHQAPAALLDDQPMRRASGAGLDPCAALTCSVDLGPGQTVEVVWLLGQESSLAGVQNLIERYRVLDLDEVLAGVEAWWQETLGAVQVNTPERSLDIMLNGWLMYQAIACRLWARSAFYQASGAYGFRDQLQDGLALAMNRPALAREHLIRAASRQFPEGDVQHWWLPESGQGVRTRISDDHVWLAYCCASYVQASGDRAVLDEQVAFLEGAPLGPDEHDRFFQAQPASDYASLFEHCARGLDHAVALTGELGLPLMGSGDWNDGMNRVGEQGRGQSVWLGWLLLKTLALFIGLAERRDPQRAESWCLAREKLQAALDAHAWDGDWYRRATFDDGTWLGSASSEECQIDAIAQSWAVLSGGAPPARARQAMASMQARLVLPGDDLARLFTPPFEHSSHDPGYLMAYPAGLRENGGQYSHAAMWAVLGFTGLGQGDEALALFNRLNPINHALAPAAVDRYKVEPYVVAADIYSVAPHTGRGGWSWYTGSASWMYRAGVEGLLGLRREGQWLVLQPCLAAHWPGFSATVRIDTSHFKIEVRQHAAPGAWLDGVALPPAPGGLRLPLDGACHQVLLCLPGAHKSAAPGARD
jgi:cyclic beta-1,2-glucan synthetase